MIGKANEIKTAVVTPYIRYFSVSDISKTFTNISKSYTLEEAINLKLEELGESEIISITYHSEIISESGVDKDETAIIIYKAKKEAEFGTYEAHQPNYEGFKQLGVLNDYVYQSLAHMGNASHHLSWGLTVLEHTDVPRELQEEIRQSVIAISDLREKLEAYRKE